MTQLHTLSNSKLPRTSSEGQKTNVDQVSGHVFHNNAVKGRGFGGLDEDIADTEHLSWVSRARGIWRVEERKSWKNRMNKSMAGDKGNDL